MIGVASLLSNPRFNVFPLFPRPELGIVPVWLPVRRKRSPIPHVEWGNPMGRA